MKLRSRQIKLVFAFFFILLSSFVIAELTVDFKYIEYSSEQQIYLDSRRTELTGERSVSEILILDQKMSVELRVKDGSIVEVATEPISGDLDVDIFLFVRENLSSSVLYALSMNSESSIEHITVEVSINPPSLDKLIFTDYPLAEFIIVPVTGSGIVSIYYKTLNPVPELIYLCIIIMFVGTSFFIKNMINLIRFQR
ncbi:hypothetical protein [Candidatus Borrarchaeum sp.]|uniref:hypothetical protein n=1 Tax=Candidatus Borrarchaeum sp. TaxID=2846742 RepID=UPI00257E4944|nr:hypothetical protein [Candidatus Borrarchaeum sp.]